MHKGAYEVDGCSTAAKNTQGNQGVFGDEGFVNDIAEEAEEAENQRDESVEGGPGE